MFLQQSNYFRRFWCKFVKSWQKNYEEIDVYYIGYVTFKEITNCNNINSGNPLYLMYNKVSKKCEEVWDRFKKEIETINGGKENWIWESFSKN